MARALLVLEQGGATGIDAADPAVLEFGEAAAAAMHHFQRAYDLVWNVGNRSKLSQKPSPIQTPGSSGKTTP